MWGCYSQQFNDPVSLMKKKKWCLITKIEPRESINSERYLTGSECNIRMHSRKEWRGKNCQWEKKSREALGKEGEEQYVEEDGGWRRGGNCRECVDSELYPVWLMQSVCALWCVGCDSNSSGAGLTKSGLGLRDGHTSSPAAFYTPHRHAWRLNPHLRKTPHAFH